MNKEAAKRCGKETICLAMIVKNEASVIRRCLDSVRPFITHWVIVDTGSTDGTQDIIRDYMSDMPGELYEREWRDFAHNRSEALSLARPMADYSFVIDADDELIWPENFELPELIDDAYNFTIVDEPLIYPRIQLVKNSLSWRYRGVLHEFMACEKKYTASDLGLSIRRNHDGDRRKDPAIFLRDAAIFEKALTENKDPDLAGRYTFYLAQSYRDAKNYEKALENYLKRSKMGGWEEEVYYSHYQAGNLMQALNYEDKPIVDAYNAATYSLPSRSEASRALAVFYRNKKQYEQAYHVALTSLGKALPKGGIFVEHSVYSYGILDEFANNAFFTDRFDHSIDAWLKVIETGKASKAEIDRIVTNIRISLKKIAEKNNNEINS